ncbi:citrate/2-methylcitrate synthase [Bacillus sp. SL00103]
MCSRRGIHEREENLYPNLDYYAAPIYYVLGIPISLYTPIFFAARASGLVPMSLNNICIIAFSDRESGI